MTRVRLAGPADAGQIVGLLKDCYGETYTVETAQDPAVVATRIASGADIYAVAEDNQTLLGFGVLSRKGPGLFEYYRCVVHEEARGQGLMRRLIRRALGEAESLGARLIQTGLVTSHPFAQRSVAPLGFAPLGLLLGLIPDHTEVSGIGRAVQPVSLMMLGRKAGGEQRRRLLRLAEPEQAWATEILDGLGIPSRCATASPRRRRAAPEWILKEDRSIGLAHLQCQRDQRGADDAGLFASLEVGDRRVIWADVPVEDVAAPALCERLRHRGYGVAAYLPLGGANGEDVLRFQRYLDPAPLCPSDIVVLPQWEHVRDAVCSSLLRLEEVAA